MHIVYEFDKLKKQTRGGYFFQYVIERRLSDIRHSHDFFEIIIILSGECKKEINGKIFHFKSNDIIILTPDDTHLFLDQSDDIKIISLSVKETEFTKICMSYGKSIADELCPHKSPKMFQNTDFYVKFLTLFPSFKISFEESDCIMLLSYIINLYISSKQREINNLPSELREAMYKMKDSENIKEGLTAFIRLSNYSHSHLSKLMKKHFGMSPHDYITDLKLTEAYRLLTMTDTRIEDVAEMVGYASFSHFNKIFKIKYGITPAYSRKMNRMWTV